MILSDCLILSPVLSTFRSRASLADDNKPGNRLLARVASLRST